MENKSDVRVADAFGRVLSRVLIFETDCRVFVCTKEEYIGAKRESRIPETIGFPKGDMIELADK